MTSSPKTSKQYNICLDFIKGIACIFVVFMHCEFPGLMGIAVQSISRFSVPFFFMVSGYFCFKPFLQKADYSGQEYEIVKKQRRQVIIKKVEHIAKITLYASLFYLAFVLLQQVFFQNKSFTITWRNVFFWVVFNVPKVVAGQYWFLFALLYVYVFYGILERVNLRRFAYILAAFMFVVYIVMAQGLHLGGVKIPNCFYRNWLIEGFPFFLVGHWIHENKETINISNGMLWFIIISTTFLCLVERWFMGRDFGVNIVTIPQVFALFIYGVQNPTRHEGTLQKLGRDCSMLVYIIHPAVWHTVDGVYNWCSISDNMFALYMRPLLVLGFSILLAAGFNYFISFIRLNQQKV